MGKERFNVLYLEPNAETAELVSNAFSRNGLRVTSATNLADFSSCLASSRPNFILLSHKFPRASGLGVEKILWEVVDTLKSDPNLKGIPRAIYSSSDGAESQASKRGEAFYMHGRTFPNALAKVVHEAISGGIK